MNLCSHGIGKSLHEAPTEVLPYYDKHDQRLLKEGMVITIEPFFNNGSKLCRPRNRWMDIIYT